MAFLFINRPAVRQFALLFVLYTAVAFLFATQWYTYDSKYGHAGPYMVYLRWNIEQWGAWLILSPLVLRIAARRPIDPNRPFRTLPLHLAASIMAAFLALLVQAMLAQVIEPNPSCIYGHMALLVTKDVVMGILAYWALTVLAQTLRYHKENGLRQVRESQLEQKLAQTQLQVLQMQLHPHFLFNTLHAIGTLIREEPEAAEQMLLDLSALLRVFLEQETTQLISLRRELHLADLYLNIQKIRFRDRLSVRTHVTPSSLDYSVPSLVLQPLVENAIVHGIAKHPGSDEIEIASRLDQETLLIEIFNANSVLAPNEEGEAEGVGLSNTRQRLAQLFHGKAQLTLEAGFPRGVVCAVRLPLIRAAAAPTPEEALLSL